MIFVTVGTHEQQFNRLIEYIDKLNLEEEVFMQIGYSTYEPKNCMFSKMIAYDDMQKYTKEASLIITHGGPGSIMLPLQYGKVPIVVPRQHQYGEHVNDHQVLFTRHLERELKVLAVYDINQLKDYIDNYENFIKNRNKVISSNTESFNNKFIEVVDDLFSLR